MDSNVLLGFLKVIAISLAPVAIIAVVLRQRVIAARGGALLRRLHLWPAQSLEPTVPPIEEVAATLRRLRPLAHHPGPGVRMAKYRGTVAAYDGRLVQAAYVLEVPTSLDELPENSFDREAERMRLEHALTDAGLSWQVQES